MSNYDFYTISTKSKINAIKAAMSPAIRVAVIGVFVRALTRLNSGYSRPSDDIAYRMRGNGNIAPSKLVHRANTAPAETTHLMLYQPN